MVYEKTPTNWSAFSPYLPGCGSIGDAPNETRHNMREASELYLAEIAKTAESIPNATAAKVDFGEFDLDHQTKQHFVEWLAVSLPQAHSPREEAHQAA